MSRFKILCTLQTYRKKNKPKRYKKTLFYKKKNSTDVFNCIPILFSGLSLQKVLANFNGDTTQHQSSSEIYNKKNNPHVRLSQQIIHKVDHSQHQRRLVINVAVVRCHSGTPQGQAFRHPLPRGEWSDQLRAFRQPVSQAGRPKQPDSQSGANE